MQRMKRIIEFAICLALAMASGLAAGAQNAPGHKGTDNWREKMTAEKIAWFTSKLDLTAEEAQVFWPVYNELEKNRQECFAASMKAFRRLNEALKNKAPESEISSLTNEYVATLGKADILLKEYVTKFAKILPAEKVAKVLVAEEQFRRSQINKLHHGGNQGGQRQKPFAGSKPADK